MNISIAGQPAAVGGSGGGGGGGISPPAGQIGGTAGSPTVTGITETGGPTSLPIGAIADGEVLTRVGNSIVGTSGGVTFAAVNAALAGANASISVNSQKITNLANGTNAGDAVNKSQLDGKASTTHASTHAAGQSDALSGNLDATARVTVRKNTGSDIGSRRRINFVEGANVTLTVTDDPGSEEVDVEIAASGGGGGGGLDQLTGDVTAGPGTGSQAATIAAGAVTLAKMANLAQDQFIGRVTTSTGVPETTTITAAARTVLDDTTVTDMRTTLGADAVTIAGTGLTRTTNTYSVNTSQNIATLSNLTTNGFVKTGGGAGTLSVDTNTYLTGNQTVTLSGDVTGSGATAITATIANDAVTNAKLANMAASTFKGRVTASTGDPEDMTATQATSLLNVATTSVKGLCPTLSNVATEYLDGTGNWSVPAGGGGGGGILDVQHFQAESLDDATADWTNMVTTTAPLDVSVSTNSIFVRSYSGSTSQASGGKFRAPATATNVTFEWMQQARTAPGTTNNKVQWRLAFRTLGSTSSPTNFDFTVHTIPNSTTFTAATPQTVSLATLGLTAGTWYQFQLVRVISGVGNNMTQDCLLSEVIPTWT